MAVVSRLVTCVSIMGVTSVRSVRVHSTRVEVMRVRSTLVIRVGRNVTVVRFLITVRMRSVLVCRVKVLRPRMAMVSVSISHRNRMRMISRLVASVRRNRMAMII